MSALLDFFAANRDISMLALSVTLAVVVFQLRPFRQILERMFVVIGDERDSKKLADELEKMKVLLHKLQSDNSSTLSEGLRENLRHELNATASFQIQEIVDRHLRALSERGEPVVRHFESEVRDSVQEILKATPATDLVRDALRMAEAERRKKSTEDFDKLLDRQLSSANNTRAVMMNLFVAFNLTLLLVFAFMPERFSDRSSMTILGVYVSLSAFIIYIYRASNARSASLLAIKEDEKKLSDVFDFLSAFKKTPTFTNNEVEIIRTLLVNRVEREKGAEHPYEVVLKGVSNSNVLVRGGKITPSSSKKSET